MSLKLTHRIPASRGDVGMVVAAAFFATLALEDITTDVTAPGFAVERSLLFVCAVALIVVAVRLILGGRRWLGGLSLVMLSGAAWGQQLLSPGAVAGHPVAYAATLAGLIWFAALAVILALGAWGAGRAPATPG